MMWSETRNDETLVFHARHGLIYKKRHHNGQSTLIGKRGARHFWPRPFIFYT